MKRAFDLSALYDHIKSDRRYTLEKSLIANFGALSSIHADLCQAMKSLDAIQGIEMLTAATGADHNTAMRDDLGQPLMTHAVLSYCRAADQKSEGRVSTDFTGAFSPEQLENHKNIRLLRNTTLAHYGKPKGKYGELWREDRVVFRETGNGLSVFDVFLDTNYLAAAVNSLHDLSVTAAEYVLKLRSANQVKLQDAIERKRTEDLHFRRLLESCPFDPNHFFKGKNFPMEAFWDHDAAFRVEKHSLPG